MKFSVIIQLLAVTTLLPTMGQAQSGGADAISDIQRQVQDIGIDELLEKLARVRSISYDGRKHLRLRAQTRLVMEQAQAVRQRYDKEGEFRQRVDKVAGFLRAEGTDLLAEEDDNKLELRFAELRTQYQVTDLDIEGFIEWADAIGAYRICQQEMTQIAADLEASIPRIPRRVSEVSIARGSLSEQAKRLSAERQSTAGDRVIQASAASPEPKAAKKQKARAVLQRLLEILPNTTAE